MNLRQDRLDIDRHDDRNGGLDQPVRQAIICGGEIGRPSAFGGACQDILPYLGKAGKRRQLGDALPGGGHAVDD